MIELHIIILILALHWFGDFILQSDWMAKNKSKNNKALLLHISVYGLPFIVIGPLYAVINAGLHLMIDFVTSRITSKLYAEGDIHNFFVVIGLDQTLHFMCLFGTYIWMFG